MNKTNIILVIALVAIIAGINYYRPFNIETKNLNTNAFLTVVIDSFDFGDIKIQDG